MSAAKRKRETAQIDRDDWGVHARIGGPGMDEMQPRTKRESDAQRDERIVAEAGPYVLCPGLTGNRGIRQREWSVYGAERDALAAAITRILNRLSRKRGKR